MDFTVTWLGPALLDLKHEMEFLVEQDSAEAAQQLWDEIRQAADSLQQLPFRGRPLPELSPDHRQLLFGKKFRIVYRIKKNTVQIMAVIHTSRDFWNAWREQMR